MTKTLIERFHNPARNRGLFRIALLWEPRDLWIGVYWTHAEPWFDVYVCVLPYLPVRLRIWRGREGVLYYDDPIVTPEELAQVQADAEARAARRKDGAA